MGTTYLKTYFKDIRSSWLKYPIIAACFAVVIISIHYQTARPWIAWFVAYSHVNRSHAVKLGEIIKVRLSYNVIGC